MVKTVVKFGKVFIVLFILFTSGFTFSTGNSRISAGIDFIKEGYPFVFCIGKFNFSKDGKNLNSSFSSDFEASLTEEEKAWLEKHRVIKIAPDPNFAPFEFLDEYGHYLGIGADYIKIIEKMLGVRFEILFYTEWSDVISDFKSGKIDMLNTVFSNEERTSYMLFPKPYLKIPTVAVVRKGEIDQIDEKKLGRYRITMVRDYGLTGHFLNKYPGYNIIFAKNISEALEFLVSKKADVFINDIATTDWYMKENGITSLEIVSYIKPDSYLGFGVRKDYRILKDILEKAQDKIPKGTLNEILNRWIKVNVSLKGVFSKILLLAFILLSVVVIIIVFLLLINARLNSMVKQKTLLLYKELEKSRTLESELRKRGEFLDNILDELPVPMLLVSGDGKIIKMNYHFVQCSGFNRDDFENIEDFFKVILKRKGEREKFIEVWKKKQEDVHSEYNFYSYYLSCKNTGARICDIKVKSIQDVYAILFIDLTDILKLQEELKKSLEEKNLLIKEIHHRVKNNFNIVVSLLNLQKNRVENEEVKKAIMVAQNRIFSMALIHEMLYQTNQFTQVSILNYVDKLIKYLQGLYTNEFQRVDFKVEIEKEIYLPMDVAIPLGMVINEILMNSLKHAFPGKRKGVVRINILRTKDKKLEILIGDDGVGIPPEENFFEKKSLGATLIQSLIYQIKGDFKYYNKNGLTFEIIIPLDKIDVKS